MRGWYIWATVILVMTVANPRISVAQHAGHGSGDVSKAVLPAECTTENPVPHVRCASVVKPSFDPMGRLWVAWVQNGHVYAGVSEDKGDSFSRVVRITEEILPIDDNGENRPKILADANQRVFVTFTVKGKRPYTGNVMFSRSLDGGMTFSSPRSVSDEKKVSSLRFEDIGLGSDGRLYIAWLDKRDLFAAKRAKQEYRGAALYFTYSDDGGESFAPNQAIQHHTCECCRTAMAVNQGLPSIIWRNIYGKNTRDHGFVRFSAPGKPSQTRRVSADNWAVDGCPHHGPGLAIDGAGNHHVVWFTDGQSRQGIFYAQSADGGESFSSPVPLGNPDNAPEHPHVASAGDIVALAWKEFSDSGAGIYVQISRDRGVTWSAPLRAASTKGESDHPLLVSDKQWIYLSWQTMADGWQFLPITQR